MAEHILHAEPTHSRWNRDIAPRVAIQPGDIVHFDCVDASGGQVRPGMTTDEFQTIDRNRIHSLTGPVFLEGAEPGDTLEVEILEVAHKGWGWTSLIPGLGFLKERFTEPYLFHWTLDGEISRSLEPAMVPLAPFCGVMGVAPSEPGEFRTRPPGIFGGNMDVRELTAGARLYLPVLNPGALFSAGDAHAAQGDGEVCINGIECPANATLSFHLHRGKTIAAPLVESAATSRQQRPEWVVVESGVDAANTARAATERMINLLVDHWRFSPVHAYILCSATMNLRMSQVVNEPMFTVSAAISKSILPERKLF